MEIGRIIAILILLIFLLPFIQWGLTSGSSSAGTLIFGTAFYGFWLYIAYRLWS